MLGKDVEPIKDHFPVGDGGKQPIEVVLINTLREESNDSKEIMCIRAKVLEHWRGEWQIDGGCQALVVPCLEYSYLVLVPLSSQPVCIPHTVMCNSGKQGDGEWVKVKLL